MNNIAPIKVGHLTIRYLIDGFESQGLGLFELVVQPGSNAPPPHKTALLAVMVQYGLVPATFGGG